MTWPTPPGSVGRTLRFAASQLPDVIACLAHAGMNVVARAVIYDADKQLRRERGEAEPVKPRGLSEIVYAKELPDVLTEAICAAEALGL